MMRRSSNPPLSLRTLITSVLPLLACIQFLSMSALAQTITGSKSLLADLASRQTPSLQASFTYGPKFPTVGQPVQFTDVSTGNPTSWKWDFGDGFTSKAHNPHHIFSSSGFQKITLVVATHTGSKTSTKTIAVMPEAAASFVFSPPTPGPGQTVQFSDTTPGNPTFWQWDFGDGSTSTVKNPRYAYMKASTYTVTLISSDGSESKRVSKTLTVSSMSILSSSFNYAPSLPKAGQPVQFTDTSAGSPSSWQWNFGDGTTSTSENPSHAYAAAGAKTVTLTAANGSGSKTATQTIQVEAALTAAFTYSPVSPAIGQAVQFTDTSAGSPSSWLWDFNDGSKSSDRNPSHSFSNSGPYNVALVVSSTSGSNNISKNIIVGSGEGSKSTYWVSPTGTAAWENVRSETPLLGAACCSLSTANANASAGDTVYLRTGTYSTGIKPSGSGSAGNVMTFMAYPGETPTISASNARAITIVGKSYIKVDGIRSYESQAFFFIGYGACYNEITNCAFDKSSGQYSAGLITFYNTAFTEGGPSNHNWLHHNVFSRYGKISSGGNDLGTVRIAGSKTDTSAYNTFEDNIFFYGGHDNLDIGGRYNVVRNNIFHNDEAYYEDVTKNCKNTPASRYFGNRNIILTNYGDGPGTAYHTLIEGNRIGYAGAPPDDDGAMGIENAGAHTVVRYNDIFGNGASGYYSKMQRTYESSVRSGSWARVYNNNIYYNGFGDPSIGTGFKCGITIWSYVTYDNWPEDVVVINNIVYGNRAEWKVATNNILPQVTYENNFNSNPGFINTDISDKTSLVLPDLGLQPGSPCIDAGIHLTQVNGSGSNSTTLIVNDARFFQDGTWGSALTHRVTHFPDWIAIGTVANVVEIASIDYTTNTITLAAPMTWTDKAKIWLYSDSGGRRVLNETAPDIGAHEYSEY